MRETGWRDTVMPQTGPALITHRKVLFFAWYLVLFGTLRYTILIESALPCCWGRATPKGTTMTRFAAAALVTAFGTALACAPAIAAADGFVARVKTSDLNLQTEDGAKKALDRVHRAALNACSDIIVGTRIPHPDESCVSQVSAELIKRMNAPKVQAAFEAAKTSGQS